MILTNMHMVKYRKSCCIFAWQWPTVLPVVLESGNTNYFLIVLILNTYHTVCRVINIT